MMLSADPAPGGAMPVVLHSSAGGTMIHEAVGHGLEADAAVENMTVYAGKEGQLVASPLISVVDDATLAQKRGSYGFDDEGVPSQRTLLIENGKLMGWMNDRLSALKMKDEPSGNGRRESYMFRPVPRMSNTMILPGEHDPESIIRETPSGLLVRKMGGGQVNPVNRRFRVRGDRGLSHQGRQGGRACARRHAHRQRAQGAFRDRPGGQRSGLRNRNLRQGRTGPRRWPTPSPPCAFPPWWWAASRDRGPNPARRTARSCRGGGTGANDAARPGSGAESALCGRGFRTARFQDMER